MELIMSHTSKQARKPVKSPKTPSTKDYKAIVRYQDGHHELLNIRFASDIHDARLVAMDNLSAVQSLLIIV